MNSIGFRRNRVPFSAFAIVAFLQSPVCALVHSLDYVNAVASRDGMRSESPVCVIEQRRLNAQDKLRFMQVLAVTCRRLLDSSDTGVTR